MKIQKFVYDELVKKYGLQKVMAFTDSFGITVDNIEWDTSYIETEWWSMYKAANRKIDVAGAWAYFRELAQPLQEKYYNWLNKYTNMYSHWRDLVEAEAALPKLTAKLTKPLYSYVSERRYFGNGWGLVYKNKNAEAVRQCQNTIKVSTDSIRNCHKIPDEPPVADERLNLRWEGYKNILKLNPSIKKVKTKVEHEPIVSFVKGHILAPDLLEIVKEYPRTTTYTIDPAYYLLFEGYIIKTQDLYDLLVATENSKLYIFTQEGQLQIEHYNERGVLWTTTRFNTHPEWNEDNFTEVKNEINIST